MPSQFISHRILFVRLFISKDLWISFYLQHIEAISSFNDYNILPRLSIEYYKAETKYIFLSVFMIQNACIYYAMF